MYFYIKGPVLYYILYVAIVSNRKKCDDSDVVYSWMSVTTVNDLQRTNTYSRNVLTGLTEL